MCPFEFQDWHHDPVVQFPPAIEPTDAEDAFITQDPWKLSSDVPWITGVTNAEGHFKVRCNPFVVIIET